MQDACAAFFTACYSEEKGIQGFYNSLVDHAQNMAVYPDTYQIVETFLWGTPTYIYECMIKDGLSPEVHTIDDFIAEAKKHEAVKKTLDYYNKMIQQSNPGKKPATPREMPKPNLRKVGTTLIQRSCLKAIQMNLKDMSENQQLFIKPKEHHCRSAQDAHHNTKPHHNQSNMKHIRPKQPMKESRCFKCRGLGHWADKCEEKDQICAAHTEKPDEHQSMADAEQVDDDKSSTNGSHASQDTELADDEEYVEMDIYE
jgi:hypothetical protein